MACQLHVRDDAFRHIGIRLGIILRGTVLIEKILVTVNAVIPSLGFCGGAQLVVTVFQPLKLLGFFFG